MRHMRKDQSASRLGEEDPKNFHLCGVLVVLAASWRSHCGLDHVIAVETLFLKNLWALDWRICFVVPLLTYRRTGDTVPRTPVHASTAREDKPGQNSVYSNKQEGDSTLRTGTSVGPVTETLVTSKVEELSWSYQIDSWTHPGDILVSSSQWCVPINPAPRIIRSSRSSLVA